MVYEKCTQFRVIHPKMRIYQLKHANSLHFRNLQSFRKEINAKTGGRENTRPSSERVEQDDNQTNKQKTQHKNKTKQNKNKNKTNQKTLMCNLLVCTLVFTFIQ